MWQLSLREGTFVTSVVGFADCNSGFAAIRVPKTGGLPDGLRSAPVGAECPPGIQCPPNPLNGRGINYPRWRALPAVTTAKGGYAGLPEKNEAFLKVLFFSVTRQYLSYTNAKILLSSKIGLKLSNMIP